MNKFLKLQHNFALLLFTSSLLLCLPQPAFAQQFYSVNVLRPSTDYYYSTNITVPLSTMVLGGVLSTNAFAGNTTNANAYSTLLDIGSSDSVTLEFSMKPNANGSAIGGTNTYFLFPAPDGVNADTNHPVWNGVLSVTNITNCLLSTNIPGTVLSPCRYWQLGVAVNGTNGCTNEVVQVYSTEKLIRMEPK